MGIPNLYTLLRPYAQPFIFPPPSTDRDSPELAVSKNVYIDGPALAYHVYNTSLSENYYDKKGRVRKNPFDAVVEYDDYVRSVSEFLERLEGCGLKVQAIYFDGFLPAFKRPTRIARLETSLSQLIAYHNKHPEHIPSFDLAYQNVSNSSKSTVLLKKPAHISAPPFIVNTALSYLASNPRWSSLVETVPGEADGWCASNALRDGGLVISGDTDLLLYGHAEEEGCPSAECGDAEASSKLSREWGVVMLRDFSWFEGKQEGETHWMVKALIFRPYALNALLFGGVSDDVSSQLLSVTSSSTNRTGSKKSKKRRASATTPLARTKTKPYARKSSILNLAYHLKIEPTAGVSRLKQLAKASSTLPDMSAREKAFRREYALVPPRKERMVVGDKRIEQKLMHLDPRFSELVYQLPCMQDHVHPPSLRAGLSRKRQRLLGQSVVEELEIDSFLPFLYEDPTKSSAWDAGRDIRKVVYNILEAYQNNRSPAKGSMRPLKLIVKEHSRRGKKIKELIVSEDYGKIDLKELESESSILSPELMEYTRLWKNRQLGSHSAKITKGEYGCDCAKYWWIELVVEMVVRDHIRRGKEIPARSDLRAMIYMLTQAAKSSEIYNSDPVLMGNKESHSESASPANPTATKEHQTSPTAQRQDPQPRWTWRLIHIFAQVQAGVYSLWMLKQLMVFASACGESLSAEDREYTAELGPLLHKVPPIEKVIAGKQFLDGFSKRPNSPGDGCCEQCGFGVVEILASLAEKLHGWQIESEVDDNLPEIDIAEQEEPTLEDDNDEGSGVAESKEIWGGMIVDF
ncbi:XPG domain containing-domain-containing protein [Kalaharituber pfeilii]|nr:XPG domain containing-domain-containing protein [Kalaharituber pfeilii]